MIRKPYISPFMEPLEILPEYSVAASRPVIDGDPTFEGLDPNEQEW